jgi:hypothetical protein
MKLEIKTEDLVVKSTDAEGVVTSKPMIKLVKSDGFGYNLQVITIPTIMRSNVSEEEVTQLVEVMFQCFYGEVLKVSPTQDKQTLYTNLRNAIHTKLGLAGNPR